MNSLETILLQLNSLPKGYLSKKKIRGRIYYYLQTRDGSKIISVYVRESERALLEEQIAQRKRLEAQLRMLLQEGKDAPLPSTRARELTGSIMMADREVARFEKGVLVKLDEVLAPLFIVRTHNVTKFLASRSIDGSRTNARIVKKLMGIHSESDHIVSLYAHGATITDNYWFRAKGSRLKYADITFDNDLYNTAALNGQTVAFTGKPKLTPELTLTGSYEKCWKLIDGTWWLYKKGSSDEIFSEILCARLAKALGIPTAEYEQDGEDIRTRNFADQYNFEPMTSIAGDDDSYDTVFRKLHELEQERSVEFPISADYMKLIWFDSIVNNVDRHNENCGLMRDKTNGRIISIAPNFDNNLALVSRSRTLNMDPSRDGFIKYITKFLKNNKAASDLYRETDLPVITEGLIRECLVGLDTAAYDIDGIVAYLIGRYQYLLRLK